MQTARVFWSKAVSILPWKTGQAFRATPQTSMHLALHRIRLQIKLVRTQGHLNLAHPWILSVQVTCFQRQFPINKTGISVLSFARLQGCQNRRQLWLHLGDLPYLSHCWPWENHNFLVLHLKRRNNSNLTHEVVWESNINYYKNAILYENFMLEKDSEIQQRYNKNKTNSSTKIIRANNGWKT